jgi:hypothetical protein
VTSRCHTINLHVKSSSPWCCWLVDVPRLNSTNVIPSISYQDKYRKHRSPERHWALLTSLARSTVSFNCRGIIGWKFLCDGFHAHRSSVSILVLSDVQQTDMRGLPVREDRALCDGDEMKGEYHASYSSRKLA